VRVTPKMRRMATSKYRSGLEERNAKHLESLGIPYEYEKFKVKFEVNKTSTYTPDFVLPNGVIIETKGRFTSADRVKHLRVKEQHPDLDIRFVFSRSGSRLYKGAKSTYASWCEKHGFLYADCLIPKDWLADV